VLEDGEMAGVIHRISIDARCDVEESAFQAFPEASVQAWEYDQVEGKASEADDQDACDAEAESIDPHACLIM
jgi:hypothetical protein